MSKNGTIKRLVGRELALASAKRCQWCGEDVAAEGKQPCCCPIDGLIERTSGDCFETIEGVVTRYFCSPTCASECYHFAEHYGGCPEMMTKAEVREYKSSENRDMRALQEKVQAEAEAGRVFQACLV